MTHRGKVPFSIAACIAVALFMLTGCVRHDDGAADSLGQHGRYAGVGIYQPGLPWDRLLAAEASADPSAAKRVDDQAIIVVVDSRTGELRACGDLSGYCVGMNPWRAALLKAQTTPVAVTKHANPDESVAQAVANTNAAVANVTSSEH